MIRHDVRNAHRSRCGGQFPCARVLAAGSPAQLIHRAWSALAASTSSPFSPLAARSACSSLTMEFGRDARVPASAAQSAACLRANSAGSWSAPNVCARRSATSIMACRQRPAPARRHGPAWSRGFRPRRVRTPGGGSAATAIAQRGWRYPTRSDVDILHAETALSAAWELGLLAVALVGGDPRESGFPPPEDVSPTCSRGRVATPPALDLAAPSLRLGCWTNASSNVRPPAYSPAALTPPPSRARFRPGHAA